MMKRQSVPKLIRNYKDRREPSISFLKIEIKTSLMFLIIVDIYNFLRKHFFSLICVLVNGRTTRLRNFK